MNKPRISIIIPTLNEEDQIGDLLDCLKSRAGDESYEMIVADGGSSDNTRKIAEMKGALVLRCSRTGRAAQMNQGAEAARGEIFYFLHADTKPPASFSEMIHQSVLNGSRAGCFQLRFSDDHPLLRFYGWCTRFRLTIFRFGDQSLFVEPGLFWKTGGFDESLIVMEDQEIVRQLKRKTEFAVLDPPVITSARKYKENGIMKLQMIFTIILILYYAGARQEMLADLYKSLVKL